MRLHRLAVAAATLCGFCMLPAARAEVSSPADYASAVYPAALLYRDAAASLDQAQAAIKAGEMDQARAALAKAEASLALPNTALKSMRRDLERRASFVAGQLAATTCVQAPVASAPVAHPAAPPMAIGDATIRMTVARAGLHGHELSMDDVAVAEHARDTLSAVVDEAKPRMDRDPELASGVQVASDLLKDVDDDIRLAHLIADFVAGPGAASKKGMALSEKASAERDSRKRHAALKEAEDAFQTCAADSQKMMTESPVLNRTALFLSMSRTSPKKVASACAQQQKAIAHKIAAR